MDRQTKIRVLLVDDHRLFRAGLRSLLAQHGFDVVGEAGGVEEALALVSRRRPDVVLIELELPDGSGIEATRGITSLGPGVRVLMLTVSSGAQDVIASFEAGAAGYLLKEAGADEIVRAIEAAAHGDTPLSAQVARHLVDRACARVGRPGAPARARPALTARELEVLALVAEGVDNRRIAERLHLSPTTVKHHVSSVLGKLGVESRVQAAVEAFRAGLI